MNRVKNPSRSTIDIKDSEHAKTGGVIKVSDLRLWEVFKDSPETNDKSRCIVHNDRIFLQIKSEGDGGII